MRLSYKHKRYVRTLPSRMGENNKRRNYRVTFAALLEYMHGTYEILNEGKPPPMIPLVMFALATCEQSCSVVELAKIAGISLKNCSRVLKQIRKRGWAKMEGDPADERKRMVRLTEAGLNVLKLINGAAVDTAFRIVENVMGKHPSNPNTGMRPKNKGP